MSSIGYLNPFNRKNSNFSKLPFTRDLLCSLFRQVSKVLSPNSLIWKIWRAWDEEQPNVMFTVKRIKNDRRAKEGGQGSQAEAGQDSRPRKSVKRRNSKMGSRPCAVDTLHPRYCAHKYLPAFLVIKMSWTTILWIFRALNRSKQMMCREIHDQMKKIINQGEIIRKHLETIKVNNYKGFLCFKFSNRSLSFRIMKAWMNILSSKSSPLSEQVKWKLLKHSNRPTFLLIKVTTQVILRSMTVF